MAMSCRIAHSVAVDGKSSVTQEALEIHCSPFSVWSGFGIRCMCFDEDDVLVNLECQLNLIDPVSQRAARIALSTEHMPHDDVWDQSDLSKRGVVSLMTAEHHRHLSAGRCTFNTCVRLGENFVKGSGVGGCKGG